MWIDDLEDKADAAAADKHGAVRCTRPTPAIATEAHPNLPAGLILSPPQGPQRLSDYAVTREAPAAALGTRPATADQMGRGDPHTSPPREDVIGGPLAKLPRAGCDKSPPSRGEDEQDGREKKKVKIMIKIRLPNNS